MLIFEIFVSLWLNECDGCVTLQDPNFVTYHLFIRRLKYPAASRALKSQYLFVFDGKPIPANRNVNKSVSIVLSRYSIFLPVVYILHGPHPTMDVLIVLLILWDFLSFAQ